MKKDKKQNKANAPKLNTIEEKIAKVKEIVRPSTATPADVARKRKKEKLTMDDVEKEGFQAHDYSKADFAMFAGKIVSSFRPPLKILLFPVNFPGRVNKF